MKRYVAIGFLTSVLLVCPSVVSAQVETAEDVLRQGASPDIVRTAIVLTTLAVIPALFIVMTSFIRIVVVLSMVRHAFAMPQTPPNPVLISLAFFLTLFVMAPTFTDVNALGLQPYLDGSLNLSEAASAGATPIKDFMLSQTREENIGLMYELARAELPADPNDVSLLYLTPAFILNELTIAFTIGFLIMLPFLMIDLVVASILLSLGMMMVPPATISLPIKLLMFVVIDGWALILTGIVGGFG